MFIYMKKRGFVFMTLLMCLVAVTFLGLILAVSPGFGKVNFPLNSENQSAPVIENTLIISTPTMVSTVPPTFTPTLSPTARPSPTFTIVATTSITPAPTSTVTPNLTEMPQYLVDLPKNYLDQAVKQNNVIMISTTKRVSPGNYWLKGARTTMPVSRVTLSGMATGTVEYAWIEPAVPMRGYCYQYILVGGNMSGSTYIVELKPAKVKPGSIVLIYDTPDGFWVGYSVISPEGDLLLSGK